MKKLIVIILIGTLIFIPNVFAKEQTLNQLQAEAKANREAYNKAKNQKALTESERDEASKQKTQVENEIKNINSELTTIQKEITKLQDSIKIKDKEIKNLMQFVQISNGESAYLEYAFGASSFTDFIYRISVAEQLSDYNEQLITEYNSDVENLEKKQKDLTTKQNELSKKQQELAVLEAKLNKEIETISEGMASKDDEYKTQIGLINSLKSMGCSGNDTMTSCKNKIAASISSSTSSGSTTISGSSGTTMPLKQGQVTSDYGWRSGEYHTGIDFSNHAVSNVYPVAAGKVVYIVYGSTSTCGNHIVYVYHSSGYTTSYWHLTNASVKVGQTVSTETVLGQTGGPGYTDGQYYNGKYVQCAYGGHVHLNLFRGLTTTNSGRINPRIFVTNIPSAGTYFTR